MTGLSLDRLAAVGIPSGSKSRSGDVTAGQVDCCWYTSCGSKVANGLSSFVVEFEKPLGDCRTRRDDCTYRYGDTRYRTVEAISITEFNLLFFVACFLELSTKRIGVRHRLRSCCRVQPNAKRSKHLKLQMQERVSAEGRGEGRIWKEKFDVKLEKDWPQRRGESAKSNSHSDLPPPTSISS